MSLSIGAKVRTYDGFVGTISSTGHGYWCVRVNGNEYKQYRRTQLTVCEKTQKPIKTNYMLVTHQDTPMYVDEDAMLFYHTIMLIRTDHMVGAR
jgi:hypothetical protein